MTQPELLARQAALIGAVLIASGLVAVVVRRHFASVALGGFLVVVGSVVVLCRMGARENGLIAAVLLAASATLTPALFGALAQWKDIRGSSCATTLMEPDSEEPQ